MNGTNGTVENATVDVFNEYNLDQILDDELTDENGTVSFEGCGIEVRIIASEPDHKTYTIIRNLIDCRECGCVDDDDCDETELCVDLECVPVECCGVVEEHQCIPYECGDGPLCNECSGNESCVENVCRTPYTSDGECGGGEGCSDGACMPLPQCEEDADCKDSAQCIEITEGLKVCAEIGGCCGIIANHSCIAYECGTGENCMSCANGSFCIEHECILLDISPEVVENAIVVQVPDECPDCGIGAISPDGETSNHTPDSEGIVRIPVRSSGLYVVALMASDGSLYVKKDVPANVLDEGSKDFFRAMLESPWF
jgi:hypothetical protein